jgi:hypothetical protein
MNEEKKVEGVTEIGEDRRTTVRIQNNLLQQICVYRLYVNLAVLAGWVSIVAAKGLVMSILIPIGSVLALLLSMVGLHSAFDFIKSGADVARGNSALYKMIELNANSVSNLFTVLILIGFLINMYLLPR